ncbi:hypothetical protein KAK07_14895 [Ideonella sp. 4Y16]|uniref:ABC-type transport auxiliary lipoprotein component domain-containing protein n=1 Tax=Ideonella alba TaxID=2824118 RepID=A0A941BE25_9BURK|nr:hypothetical protein [Ideonella alba]MBQ0929522.1 hypothetical protein [Ideonella alba]MBQ0944624.1 hypothetical protein [Ideonella alba]
MKLGQIVLLALSLVGCAVPPVQRPAILVPLAVPVGTETGVLALGPVVPKMQQADSIANVQYGWWCKEAPPRQLATDVLPFSRLNLVRSFTGVLEPLRYRLQKAPESVFTEEQPDYTLGASVLKVHSNVCFPFVGHPSLKVGDPTVAKGSVFVEVKWEVFSNTERRVVFSATTQGAFEAQETVAGGFDTLAINAFGASLRNLAADEGFRSALVRSSSGR